MGKAWKLIVVLWAVVVGAGRAWGQVVDAYNNDVPIVDAKGGWFNWLIAAVFLIAMSVVAFKHSKRTHLD